MTIVPGKYKIKNGNSAVVFEGNGHKVFGKYYDSSEDDWFSCSWTNQGYHWVSGYTVPDLDLVLPEPEPELRYPYPAADPFPVHYKTKENISNWVETNHEWYVWKLKQLGHL